MADPVTEASKALAEELGRQVDAAIFDDLIVDEETGEVLEWPDELRDVPGRIEYLTMLERNASEAVKSWEQHWKLLRRMIGVELERADLRSLRTRYGTPAFKGRTTETGRPERIPDVAREYELPAETVADLYACAQTLDVKKLRALPQHDDLPAIIAALIDRTESTWVQVAAPRPEPPSVKRETRERE